MALLELLRGGNNFSARLFILENLSNNSDLFGGAGDGGVEPLTGIFPEGPAFIKQDNIIPLGALRFVGGEDIAKIKFIQVAALGPGEFLFAAFKEMPPDPDADIFSVH